MAEGRAEPFSGVARRAPSKQIARENGQEKIDRKPPSYSASSLGACFLYCILGNLGDQLGEIGIVDAQRGDADRHDRKHNKLFQGRKISFEDALRYQETFYASHLEALAGTIFHKSCLSIKEKVVSFMNCNNISFDIGIT